MTNRDFRKAIERQLFGVNKEEIPQKGTDKALQWAMSAFAVQLGYKEESPEIQLFDSEEQGENYVEELRQRYRGELQ